jgi:hypothetical protein
MRAAIYPAIRPTRSARFDFDRRQIRLRKERIEAVLPVRPPSLQ